MGCLWFLRLFDGVYDFFLGPSLPSPMLGPSNPLLGSDGFTRLRTPVWLLSGLQGRGPCRANALNEVASREHVFSKDLKQWNMAQNWVRESWKHRLLSHQNGSDCGEKFQKLVPRLQNGSKHWEMVKKLIHYCFVMIFSHNMNLKNEKCYSLSTCPRRWAPGPAARAAPWPPWKPPGQRVRWATARVGVEFLYMLSFFPHFF